MNIINEHMKGQPDYDLCKVTGYSPSGRTVAVEYFYANSSKYPEEYFEKKYADLLANHTITMTSLVWLS